MSKVKIVFFIDVLKKDFDGVSNTTNQIAYRLPRDQFDAIFITPLPPEDPEFPFPVYICPSIDIPLYKQYKLALPKRMKGLEAKLDDFKPDIVHWSTPSALGWYAVDYAKKRKIPVATIYHTHFTSYVEYFLRFVPGIDKISPPIARRLLSLYKDCSLVLAPTESMSDYLKVLRVNAANIRVWGRGVNQHLFSPAFRDDAFFSPYGVTNEKKILFVSRLVSYKSTDSLIELYKLLDKGHKLIITGDGPDMERLQSKMPEAVFTGKLTGEALSKVFASADVFVFPSVTETFGNVILEAMASGLPVVAARAGGPADIIEDGVTGFLAEPGNTKEMYDRIKALLADDELHARIREKAIYYASQQNWDVLCQRLFDYYTDLAGTTS
ncbi:MAG: glycosyltransferase family 4 protein [Imperialibacter sp.]|uniref:glycosyltransferase family 4 protein n=1 Tax=Imperialibacter sp. TaxID=2038411 RepID=UPI003A84A2A2